MKQRSLSVVQMSDLHFDPSDPKQQANMAHVVARVRELSPDLIIVSGDVSAEGHHHPDRLHAAKEIIDQLPSPVYVIPGNHDVGNKLGVGVDEVSVPYVDRWLEVMGADRFVHELGNWRLIGLNSQIIGSGQAREAEQLAWASQQLEEAASLGRLVAMFLHTPPYVLSPDEAACGKDNYWASDPEPRQSVLPLVEHPFVRLLAHGHLHWYFWQNTPRHLRVWCPSLNFIVDDANFPRGGGVSGIIRYHLTDTSIRHELIEMDMDLQMVWFDRPQLRLADNEVVIVSEVVVDQASLCDQAGKLLPGVAERLETLGRRVRITVIHNSDQPDPAAVLAGLPVDIWHLQPGEDKAAVAKARGKSHVIAIGSTATDLPMCEASAMAMRVPGPDGLFASELSTTRFAVDDIAEALRILNDPNLIDAHVSS